MGLYELGDTPGVLAPLAPAIKARIGDIVEAVVNGKRQAVRFEGWQGPLGAEVSLADGSIIPVKTIIGVLEQTSISGRDIICGEGEAMNKKEAKMLLLLVSAALYHIDKACEDEEINHDISIGRAINYLNEIRARLGNSIAAAKDAMTADMKGEGDYDYL